MSNTIDEILVKTGEQYKNLIIDDARHYLEFSLGSQAQKLGYRDLQDRFKNVPVIVPLRRPQRGMKVRIDGRTFKNYRQFDSGLAVPGYLALESALPGKAYKAHDSMILNFT